MTVEMPGLERGDVEISLEDNVLTIRGEKRMEADRDDKNVYVSERAYGVFLRTIELPPGVDPSSINATMQNGVLKITIPKPANAEAKKIEVKEGGNGRASASGSSSASGSQSSGSASGSSTRSASKLAPAPSQSVGRGALRLGVATAASFVGAAASLIKTLGTGRIARRCECLRAISACWSGARLCDYSHAA